MRRLLEIACVLAAVALIATLGFGLRQRPCIGDPAPAKLDATIARVWSLPIVTPRKIAETSERTLLVSYPTSGRTTYAAGPFAIDHDWTQSGNDAHTLGPPFDAITLRPGPNAFDVSWSVQLLEGPDYDNLLAQPERVEIRRDEKDRAWIVVVCSSSASSRLYELPPREDGKSCRGLTYLTLQHDGHRAFTRPGLVFWEILSVAIALLVLWFVRKNARYLGWEQGHVDAEGRVVPDNGAPPFAIGGPKLREDALVLFRGTHDTGSYRQAPASAAHEVVVGSKVRLASTLRVYGLVGSLAGAVAVCLAVMSLGAESERVITPMVLAAPPVASHAPAAAPIDAGVDAASDEDPFLTAPPKAARSIGHTSIVFKIELANGKKCAYKPTSRRGGKRWRGEVAARRLAVALGLPNVPPAFPRTFRDAELRAVAPIDPYANEVVADAQGMVHGALMPWIEKLEFPSLESDTKWKAWLERGASIPEDQKTIAADMSTMIAFDFVTGNWDRWSGGNIGFDRAANRVLYIDNDGAFFDVVPKDAMARSRRLLAQTDRFSKSFVARVRTIDLASALGEESPGIPLVTPKALAGALERREELLRIIDEKRADSGEDEVLFFP